jgi:hypothetical protein
MAAPDQTPTHLQRLLKRLWLHGFLAGFGLLLAILLVWLIFSGWPKAPPEQGEGITPLPQAPAAPATPTPPLARVEPAAPAMPSPTLKADLEAVLARVAKANREKDRSQLLGLYDPAFPDLSRKADEIARSWAIYDYRSLHFSVDEITSSSPHEASARVTWEVETQNRATKGVKRQTITYLVRFAKDGVHWRIKSSEKAGLAKKEGTP